MEECEAYVGPDGFGATLGWLDWYRERDILRTMAGMPKPYYEQDGITIYNGDCREILPQLQPVDLVLTDPSYGEHVHAKQWIGHALTADGAARCSTAFTELGFASLTDSMRSLVAAECVRLAKRWSLVFCDIEGIWGWKRDLTAVGLEYIRTLIWDKVDSAPQFTGDRPANGAEAIVCAHPVGKKEWNGGGKRNVFRYRVNAEKGAKPHPSTKPLPLLVELVGLFSNQSETVLDCFMGSGTTLVAAKQCYRKAIGIEIEEKYCEVAAKRLSQQMLDLAPLESETSTNDTPHHNPMLDMLVECPTDLA